MTLDYPSKCVVQCVNVIGRQRRHARAKGKEHGGARGCRSILCMDVI